MSLAVPLNPPLVRGRLVGLWLLAVALGLAVAAVALGGLHAAQSWVPVAIGLGVGWSFVQTGLIAWSRRPESAFGRLMVAVGLLWLLQGLLQSDEPWAFTAGLVVTGAAFGPFVQLLLGYPSGRIPSSTARLLVAATYGIVTVGTFLRLLVSTPGDAGCDCPSNRLQLWHDGTAARIADVLQEGGALVVAAGVLALLVDRRRRATAPARRVLAPVLWSSGLIVLLLAVHLAGGLVLDDVRDDVDPVGLVALAAVPAVFLVGLLRLRLARSASVGGLVLELGASGSTGGLRGALARALGDESLELAYWMPEAAAYVDADGHPVELHPDGARATTVLSRGGRPVAALVHDPALRDDPGFVEAVSGAAGLALENERLQAELRARLEELQASRARIVEAGDAERRRLERNLHDGAQQRLVSLSLSLRLAQRRLRDDPEGADALLDGAGRELTLALAELRELARGIHPAVLTDRGLKAALEALASRLPLPMRLGELPEGRLPPAAEAAAYFVAAEAVTNVIKYARASAVDVEVTRRNGHVIVDVRDDGIGGADPGKGSGLRGLADRVAALDGRLVVQSPAGRGTCVRAEIPCAS